MQQLEIRRSRLKFGGEYEEKRKNEAWQFPLHKSHAQKPIRTSYQTQSHPNHFFQNAAPGTGRGADRNQAKNKVAPREKSNSVNSVAVQLYGHAVVNLRAACWRRCSLSPFLLFFSSYTRNGLRRLSPRVYVLARNWLRRLLSNKMEADSK